MNPPSARPIRPIDEATRLAVALGSILLLVIAVAVVTFATLRSPLKDDIAWLLYVARRWMAGRELYVDVVEVNPPLIVWISAIPLEIARWLDVGVKYVAMPGFMAAVLGCAWWAATLLRQSGSLFADRIPVFAAIGTVFLIVPAGDLGQREHLLVAAVLPYLILFAGELEGRHPRFFQAIFAGSLAGLGCALKPRYAGAFAVLECLALFHGLRPWRALPIAAGSAMAIYGLGVAVFCPAYLRRAVPLALALYGATDVSFRELLLDSAILMAGEAAAIGLLWLRWRHLPERRLFLTVVMFAATSTAICFVDGKDWFYHRLPATIVTVLALLGMAVSTYVHRRTTTRRIRLPLALAAMAVMIFAVTTYQRLEPEVAEAVEPRDNTVARLEALIRKEHARTYIAFSEWIALGFPVVNNTGVAWASRFDSMWALKGELWRARFDPSASREWPVARWVAHDFIAGCPDIAVVDGRESTNYIGVLSASDPAFARAWSRYHQIAAFDGLTVYRRGKGGCIDPWVATGAAVATDVR
jgi:hypothetical protein